MATPGYIYILVNAAMPKVIKVGKTTKSPEARAVELSCGTGIAAPFVVAFDVQVTDCDAGEAEAHAKLNNYRVTSDREFFTAPLKEAIALLNEIAERDRRLAEEAQRKAEAERAASAEPPLTAVGRAIAERDRRLAEEAARKAELEAPQRAELEAARRAKAEAARIAKESAQWRANFMRP